MANILHKQAIDRPVESVFQSLCIVVDQLSEWFWFLLSFVLFIALGPFSAPIVIIALFKLGLEDNDNREPESVSSK